MLFVVVVDGLLLFGVRVYQWLKAIGNILFDGHWYPSQCLHTCCCNIPSSRPPFGPGDSDLEHLPPSSEGHAILEPPWRIPLRIEANIRRSMDLATVVIRKHTNEMRRPSIRAACLFHLFIRTLREAIIFFLFGFVLISFLTVSFSAGWLIGSSLIEKCSYFVSYRVSFDVAFFVLNIWVDDMTCW